MCAKSDVNSLLKFLMFLFNAVFWLVGLSVFCAGVWAFTEKNRLTADTGSSVSSLQSKYSDVFDVLFDLTILIIILGLVIFLLSFVGCVGALRENICLLKCFSYTLGVLLLVEFTLAVLAFIFSTEVKVKVIEVLQMEALVHYRDDDDLRNVIDWTQHTFSCCGVGADGYRDWSYNAYFNCTADNPSMERCGVPYSCCISPNDVQMEYINTQCGHDMQQYSLSRVKDDIYAEGCVHRVLSLAKQNLLTIGGLALGVAVLQMVGILISQTLVKHVRSHRLSYLRNT